MFSKPVLRDSSVLHHHTVSHLLQQGGHPGGQHLPEEPVAEGLLVGLQVLDHLHVVAAGHPLAGQLLLVQHQRRRRQVHQKSARKTRRRTTVASTAGLTAFYSLGDLNCSEDEWYRHIWLVYRRT